MLDDLINEMPVDFQGNPKPLQQTTEVPSLSVEYSENSPLSDSLIEVLHKIDELCKKNHLEYFAFGSLLTSIIHYGDFISDGKRMNIDIGLLRKDYDVLLGLLSNQELGKDIIFDYLSPNGYRKRQVRLGKKFEIETNEIKLFDVAWVHISVFDFVPDEYDARKGFFRKMEKLNKRHSILLKKAEAAPGSGIIDSFFAMASSFFAGKNRAKKSYYKIYNTATKFKDTNTLCRVVPNRSTIIEKDGLFPLSFGKLRDLQIPYPKDFTLWTTRFNEELIERTKKIQRVDLVLLKEFDRICRKLNIGYFICGGSMLGHKRDNGFIPWDDDIDVGMLRTDYDRFVQEGAKLLSEDFFFQTRKTDKNIPYLFSKIRMNGTEYITKYNEKRKFHKGICLDLFPFDFVPNDFASQMKFKREVRHFENIHNKFANRQIERVKYDTPPKTLYDGFYRVYNDFRRRIVRLIPLSLTQFFYIKKATKYNQKAKELSLTTVASFVPTYTYINLTQLLPYKDITFEGVKAKAICDEDAFLTMQYGDYMQLPMLHQRVGHDLISWSVSDEIKQKYHI